MKKDFLLNIVASLLLTAATQLVCYPVLALVMDAGSYGLMLTCMGVVNAVGVAFGSSLNNARLLRQHDYEGSPACGDFNRILLCSAPVCFVSSALVCALFCSQEPLYAALEGIVSVLVLLRGYYSVRFRLVIVYRKMLFMSFFGALGYILGSGVAWLSGIWPIPFIVGEAFAVAYAVAGSPLLREGFAKTGRFRSAFAVSRDLLGTSIVSNMTVYLDRFLILPVLGAQMVSYYTVASLLGKMAAMVASPMAGVLLTYYAKDANGVARSVVIKRFLLILAAIVVCTGAVILVSEPVLCLLYPSLADGALPYCALASLASIVLIGGNMLQPTMLVVCDSKLQPIVQGIHLLLLVGLGYFLSSAYGLYGFCAASVAANSTRLLLMYLLTWKNAKSLPDPSDAAA